MSYLYSPNYLAVDEQFLYYVWSNKLFKGELATIAGDSLEVVGTGYRNTDSGPDFKEAKVKINNTLWAGNVEIHVRTSDWNRHHHQHDPAYKNVILHVVYEHDADVNDIPVLQLKSHFDEALFDSYAAFVGNRKEIACANGLSSTQKFSWLSWMDTLIVERMQKKTADTDTILSKNTFDWEDTFYRQMLRYMGMKVNNEAFAMLANTLPFRVLQKHADNLTQVEAMLFGCAGLLDGSCNDDYAALLMREFNAMQAKFNLKTMPASMWKFMRMRPGNFPTVRMAQAAQVIHRNTSVFSKILACRDVNEVKAVFDVATSPYWETHYRFGVSSPRKAKHLGDMAANTLIINAVLPLMFAWGKRHERNEHCENAIAFMEAIEAEDNKTTRIFAKYGFAPQNAMHSQAMLTLYDNYCKTHRCLECRIGNILINSIS